MDTLFNFLLGLVNTFAQFTTWLTTDLPVLNMAPLAIFSFTGLTIILGYHVVRLVVGG